MARLVEGWLSRLLRIVYSSLAAAKLALFIQPVCNAKLGILLHPTVGLHRLGCKGDQQPVTFLSRVNQTMSKAPI